MPVPKKKPVKKTVRLTAAQRRAQLDKNFNAQTRTRLTRRGNTRKIK